MRCVVFGATGYIGGRLVPRLLEEGHRVRAVARTPAKLSEVAWRDDAEILAGDVTKRADVAEAVAGQDIVYYLVHSLNSTNFADIDREAAGIVAESARSAGVSRIVYLGGITPETGELSAHLASRSEVADILLQSGVPTVVLRAAVILGSGSASFEMLRYLTERLPMMVVPSWVHNRVQPIGVRDVLYYLTHAAGLPAELTRSFDIGGPDVLTYMEMMRRFAVVAQLPRRMVVPVPALTPWLSAQWVNLVTPVPRSIAVPLVESLVHEVVCADHSIADHIPDPPEGLIHYEHAIALALARVHDADVPTRWSDATTPGTPSDPMPTDPEWAGGTLFQDVRERHTDSDPQTLWNVIESIGGEHGWYSFPLAWSIRGWIDRISGGVGLRRGRRDPRRLRVGEALDWWRVEHIERPEILRLRAEMKLPGRAWLELSVVPEPNGTATYRQRALFEPHGLAGQVYWRSISVFHFTVFAGMARNITGTAATTALDKRSK